MEILSNTFPPERLTRIDSLTISDHYYLTENSVCYFLGEYTSHTSYEYSQTNKLISNFKKPLSKKGKPEWKYKLQAIERVASAFRETLDEDALRNVTLVPIPPSKAKDDPLYDDRINLMLSAIYPELDIRDLIEQVATVKPAHSLESGGRPNPEQLKENYKINSDLLLPTPKRIWIFDDILTTGSHFIAISSLLEEVFPETEISGFFIARRIFPAPVET